MNYTSMKARYTGMARSKASNNHASIIISVLISLALVSSTNGGSIVVYWGQDKSEGSLSSTCNSGLYKIINIAFLATFGSGSQPQVNLAGHCDPTSNGCRALSRDIKHCQSRGIKILISIGGGNPGYSLSSSQDAKNLADYIWNNFLGGRSSSRPLGDAVLDGVDFDIEVGAGESHYGEVARRLIQHSQGGKKVYLSAAPQCPFPDKHLNGALSTGMFDYVWIQFYNNGPCQFDSGDPSKFQRSWKRWTSSIKAGEFYVGVPASASASTAGSGFVSPQVLMNQVLPFVKRSGGSYGGVMLWDRSADVKTGYGTTIKGSV